MTNEETLDGPTSGWMVRQSATFSVEMPPDTRPKCREWVGLGTCGQPALDGGLCAAHVADGVL